MVVPPTTLNILRAQLRKRRRCIDNSTTLLANQALSQLITSVSFIGAYVPIGGEPDPFPLMHDFLGNIGLPALERGNLLMTFQRWSVGDSLVATSWGGQQPSGNSATLIPNLIFVPMLGFDAALNRIGQGGGHYDRYLAAHPQALRIGLAWDVQRVDSIEARPWDIPMDAILTEAAFHVKDLTRCQRP
jgi:5-formyltetrahydrofolate cyclo-ligase